MTAPVIETSTSDIVVDNGPNSTGAPAPAAGKPKESVDDLPEWARKSLTDANAEAARYRTSLRAQEAAAAKLQEDLAKAKTPEEFEAAVNDLKATISKLELEVLRKDAAREYGIPEALEARLMGTTADEIKADAKALSELIGAGASATPSARLSGGRTPAPAGPSSTFDPLAAARAIEQGQNVLLG